MRRFRGSWSLIIVVAVAVVALSYTFVVNNRPLLGLDLQGGVSVVLQPKNGTAQPDTLNQAISIIRQRIDALGVAEPEITRQGNNILVQIPGVKDKDRALSLVGQTAELVFRPVLNEYPATPAAGSTTTTGTGSTATTVAPAPGAASTDTTATTAGSTGTSQVGMGLAPGELAMGGSVTPPTVSDGPMELAQAGSSTTATTVAPAAAATSSSSPSTTTATTTPPGATALPSDICVTGVPDAQRNPTGQALLPQCDKKTLTANFLVGPVALKGDALSGANAVLNPNGQWTVNPIFKGGSSGIDQFNAIATKCFNKDATVCPTGQLAIVLDGRVISAPVIQNATFQADQIQISGQFTQSDAKDLATALKYGALPVELIQQQAQIVSATLGQDALRAGLVSGIVGLILVAAYMIFFYRLLGALAIVKLAIEGALLWSVIAYLGTSSGLALTLAGITGIIVSIGVSVDSNVVYYEHIKEDVLNGKTLRTATDKSFVTAFSTIVKADVASLIAAGLLWWLTVGPVRGFAFYLGLSTLLDLLTSWFYMRPVVHIVSRSRFSTRPRLLGLPVDAEGEPATASKVRARPTPRKGGSR